MYPISEADKSRAVPSGFESKEIKNEEGAPTILLVEDDRAIREITATLLEHHGFRVLDVSNGREALNLLASSRRFDALLLDFELPGMNGLAVAEAARKLRPGIPALYVTGYGAAAERRGVPHDRIVSKPFRDEDLARRLRALIGLVDAPIAALPTASETRLLPKPGQDDIRLIVAYG